MVAHISCNHVVDSPDTTILRVSEFSMDRLIRDFEHEALDLLQLFKVLSQSSRNIRDGSLSVETIKVVVSLYTLLNARRKRANQFQFLMSITLIARAASKQVRIYGTFSYKFTAY